LGIVALDGLPRQLESASAARSTDLLPAGVRERGARRENRAALRRTQLESALASGWNAPMHLALFDLDDTLLAADSDMEWDEILAEHGAMDLERSRAYHDQYRAGTLDIDAFLLFQLAPLARHPLPTLIAWRERFLAERVRPRLSPRGIACVREHAARGHEIALITATNDFLSAPIARELGIPHLLASRAEVRAGRFTGRCDGRPCFREGKIACLDEWLAKRALRIDDVSESWFYSDSHNDLALLGRVDHPIAVDPDPVLEATALERGWAIERWRP
jgi:HAD superfamily hydrolase (TIGR01490 family)